MNQAVASGLSTADIVGFGVALFSCFFAQGVALYIWYRRSREEHRREQRRIEEKHEQERKEQLAQLQEIINKDIGSVRREVEDIREELTEQERLQSQRNEQLHGHLRRIEESRPSREEVERNMTQLKELVLLTKSDLEKAVMSGFQQVDRRFDEFRDYTRDLVTSRRD